MNMKDKVVLVTGGTRGIGKAIVYRFHQAGASVVFSFRSSDKLAKEMVDELGEDRTMCIRSDAGSMSSAQALVDATIERFGSIDALINNAGITKDNLMLRMTEEQWDEVIRVNLGSVFNLTKSVLRQMLRQRSGSIINMGSVVGIFGNAGQANYAASKAGIIGFSKSVAKEVGSRGIRCNVIAPGFIQTEMTDELADQVKESYIKSIPLQRFGEVSEIAEACLFLASDASRYITGQVISVCGGLNM